MGTPGARVHDLLEHSTRESLGQRSCLRRQRQASACLSRQHARQDALLDHRRALIDSGGVRRLLAAIQDPDSIERVLRAIGARCRARGLPWQAPELAVARAPPEIWG